MINEETFNEAINSCRCNYQKGFCNWGKCVDCGVVPLLLKLHKNEIVEDESEVTILKKDYLCN